MLLSKLFSFNQLGIYLNKVAKDRCLSFSTNHFDNFRANIWIFPKGQNNCLQKKIKKINFRN